MVHGKLVESKRLKVVNSIFNFLFYFFFQKISKEGGIGSDHDYTILFASHDLTCDPSPNTICIRSNLNDKSNESKPYIKNTSPYRSHSQLALTKRLKNQYRNN